MRTEIIEAESTTSFAACIIQSAAWQVRSFREYGTSLRENLWCQDGHIDAERSSYDIAQMRKRENQIRMPRISVWAATQ